MAFRYDEALEEGTKSAKRYLIGRNIDPPEREKSESELMRIIDKYGPAVDCYPTWHPLVSVQKNPRSPAIVPGENCGYEGLDHTIYFRNAFITCPYHGEDKLIASVQSLKPHPVATISAERIDAQFFASDATPILVSCEWHEGKRNDGMIPKSIAIPLILESEVPCWRWASVAETWETMRPYLLGQPCGSRSSMFVNQATGQTIKKVWNELINTGMFGPIRVD
ncbi:MAG: hypothetical protein ACSHYA_12835 [Opitutaceae bacterium]